MAVFLQQGVLRHERRQRLNARPSTSGGNPFQQLADQKEEDDGCGLLSGVDDNGADGRDLMSISIENGVPESAAVIARRAIGTRPISTAATKA
ncbi:hypothetical protein AJ87_16385 [Rhizobium yanglingense]|nr:hypothetical protein AJ87_16385 [Rhizobium yanglingense]